jgi:hypothetical protein
MPWVDEKTLRSQLSRLTISAEAQIVNGHAPERESPPPPAADVIFEGNVPDIDDPFIVVDEPAEDSDGETPQDQHVFAIWKLPIFIVRPRIRLQTPAAMFSASAILMPASRGDPDGPKSSYLKSGVPSGLNLLQAFSNDPAMQGVTPRLSALRISRVAPVTQPKDVAKAIRALPNLTIKVFPAVHTRVKFSRPNTVPSSATLIALLEIDFTPYFECEMSLDKISLQVTDGTVENLNEQAGMALPMTCVAQDHITFLYKLTPMEQDIPSSHPTRNLDITIETTANVIPGVCTPHLSMAWTTTLDFTLPVNPGFGPAMQPIRRSHRPSQLSISGESGASLTAPSVSRPDSLPSLEAATKRTETTIPDLGITMTFTGPSAPIYTGDVFTWSIYVVNRSSEKANPTPPRKLALLAIPKRRRNDLRIMRPPSTSGGGKKFEDAKLLADAVLDENVVHTMQRNSIVDSTDVICLSADTRVGPLAVGACHVVELKFLALREGIVGAEAIRVVDLGTQEHVDVRELPVVVVQKKPEIDN